MASMLAASRPQEETVREWCIADPAAFLEAMLHRGPASIQAGPAGSPPCLHSAMHCSIASMQAVVQAELHRVLACCHAGRSSSCTCLDSVRQCAAGPDLK